VVNAVHRSNRYVYESVNVLCYVALQKAHRYTMGAFGCIRSHHISRISYWCVFSAE